MQIDPIIYERLKRIYGEPVPEEAIAEAVADEKAKLEEEREMYPHDEQDGISSEHMERAAFESREATREAPPADRNLTQGKCCRCKIRFVWRRGRMQVRQAHCPYCGEKLRPTTHVLKWTCEEISRPLTAIEAWQRAKERR